MKKACSAYTILTEGACGGMSRKIHAEERGELMSGFAAREDAKGLTQRRRDAEVFEFAPLAMTRRQEESPFPCQSFSVIPGLVPGIQSTSMVVAEILVPRCGADALSAYFC